MYEPAHFRIEDRDELVGLVRQYPLGLLISHHESGLLANPLPFLIHIREDGVAILRAHLARANPHWKALGEGQEVLVVFQPSEHYITPAWYLTKQQTGKVVPTWNYLHIQMRGIARVKDDPAFIAAQISALTDQQEAGRQAPWAVADAPEAFISAQMRGIVGLEIEISAMSGKYKLSQNRNEADFSGVIDGLDQEKDAQGPAMSKFIRNKRDMIS